MRRMKRLSLIAGVILVLAICLTACGGSSDPLDGDAAVGTWTMTGAEYGGYTLTADDLAGAMEDMPVFTINADGSASFAFSGDDGTGTVTKNDDGTYTLSDDSDQTMDFTVADGKLTLDYTELNMKMIFEQTTEE